MSSAKRSNIHPNPPRWKANPDPASIVVPGLDTDASTTDQIEQIEQLITIKLQNIDENFSKIHNALANKLLPAVKRYAVGTEPVREAAKFWTSFYEQAAQIRIPTFDDYSTVNETPSEHEENQSASQERASNVQPDQTVRSTQDEYESSVVTVNSETSFLPGQGAFSSTPAMSRAAAVSNPDHTYGSQNSDDPSWTPSVESPLVRLNREIASLAIEQSDDSLLPSSSTSHMTTQEQDSSVRPIFQREPSIAPRSEKGKGKDPLLKNVLRHNLYSAADNSSFESKHVSPLKFRGKPKTPVINKSLNPYLQPQASPAEWSGVVDLRDPSVSTPQKYRSGKSAANKTATATPYADDDDDSFDGLPPGMSPPVLMSPARPPRSSAELGLLKLGRTPARDASTRIQRDLLRSTLKSGGGGGKLFGTTPGGIYESSMSAVSSPPSLSRYNRDNHYSNTSSSITKDSSLESMIRHIRDDIRPDVGATPGMATTPGLRLRPRGPILKASPQARARPQQQHTPEPPPPATPLYPQHMHAQGDGSLDSDSDSLDMDEVNTTAHPSAAFLMASQGRPRHYGDDDSFGSSDSRSTDSLGDDVDEEVVGGVPVHPFASGAVVEDDGFDDDDDSFDGFEPGHGGVLGDAADGGFTETVFGVGPAQRMQMQAAREGLRMYGQDLLEDTIGVGAQMARNGLVEESPTPASWRD